LDSATQAIAALIEASNQSEYALQEFPTALSVILADPAIGSLLIGPQGEIVLYNATAEALLGRDYMADRSMSSLQFSSEDRSTRLLADDLPWARALKGESLPDVRLHLSRPSNPDTWVNVSATPFKSPQGAITGAVVFIIDTTEEVQLEGSITTLCNTIHDQIAQVGSTHTQLRDLADRLSNVGIQRILSDSGPATNAPARPEEDPTRKKSDPRRDAGVSPTAARQASLPQAAKNKGEKDSDSNRNLVPPSPSARAKDAESDSGSRVIVPPPPSPGSVAQREVSPVEPSSESVDADADQSVEQSNSVTETSATYGVEDYDLAHSGTWASLQEKAEQTGVPESTSDSDPLVVPEGSKTLEVEKVEIEPQESIVEAEQDFPTEQSIEEMPEIALADQNATADFIDMSSRDLLNEDSTEIEAVETAEPINSKDAEVEEGPKPDFWVQDHVAEDAEAKSSEGDEAADSAKSLFGKFANLTKDSYSDPKAQEDKEPDPALPWPELVDAPDYGEPLWDEYTQSEEEATPWQQDKLGEESAFGLPPVVIEKQAQPAPEIEEAPEAGYVEEEEPVAEEHVAEFEAEAEAVEEIHATAAGDTDDTFSNLDADIVDDEPYAVPQAETELEVSHEDTEYSHTQEEEVAAAFDEVDAEVEVDDFSPIEEPASPEYAESPIEVTMEDAAVSDTTVASESVVAEDAGNASASHNKLSALKDRRHRQPASASYNRLKPLSAASELDESFLDEGLTEQVVRFSSQDLAPEDDGGPKKVLVVDDIPVNQKLLLLHLKRLGYEADVASNGQEALDMLAEKAYELILMDCDMPVMSGFEAASRIRSNEAYSHRRIPIIALTSYDREGDKEKCIASGMDDYITKGASQKELKDTIERSIVSARMKGEVGESSEEGDEADLAPLDINSMLKLYGREEVEEISRLFLSNMGTYIECMQLAIDNKDADSVAHFANAVKGPCAALGMRLMTRLTSDIMAYAESQDWTQVRVKYMRLKAVFVQTREELKKVCPDDSLLAT
jgi:CheY-like chemotaxis protein/HPt (histidine-containing phosphotransfer) domain-containing protein